MWIKIVLDCTGHIPALDRIEILWNFETLFYIDAYKLQSHFQYWQLVLFLSKKYRTIAIFSKYLKCHIDSKDNFKKVELATLCPLLIFTCQMCTMGKYEGSTEVWNKNVGSLFSLAGVFWPQYYGVRRPEFMVVVSTNARGASIIIQEFLMIMTYTTLWRPITHEFS